MESEHDEDEMEVDEGDDGDDDGPVSLSDIGRVIRRLNGDTAAIEAAVARIAMWSADPSRYRDILGYINDTADAVDEERASARHLLRICELVLRHYKFALERTEKKAVATSTFLRYVGIARDAIERLPQAERTKVNTLAISSSLSCTRYCGMR